MFLGFDCETSGLAREGLPPDDPSQPLLIKPEGWSIEPEAERVHGIPTARALRFGVRLGTALLALHDMANAARTIFAHNMQFDRLIVTAALHRAGATGNWWARRAGDMRCTMEEATDYCQLPGQYGRFRWPSLEEARAILCPTLPPFKSTHDALSDIEAAADVLREIDRRKEAA